MSELSTIYIKSYNRDRKLITTKIRITLKSSVNLADDTLILEVMVKEFEQCKVTLVLSGSLPKFNIFYLVFSCLSSFLIYFSQMSFFFFFTCVPHPNPPSHLLLHPIPLGLPSAQGPSACLMHPTWAGDLFHPR